MNDINYFKNKYNQAIGQYNILLKEKETHQKNYISYKNRLENIEKAQALIQEIAQQTQNILTYQINDIVNTALQTCFPNEYEFKLEFEIKRNKTEAKLIFLKNGYEIDPLTASGGGVVDIAAFGLRIAAWTLSNANNTIVIDEGFKFLSRDLQPKAGEILSELSKKLGIQFISVTHSPDLIENSDKIFTAKINNGISNIISEQ